MIGLFKPTTIKTQTLKNPKLTGAFVVAKDPASSAMSDAGFPQLAKPPTGRQGVPPSTETTPPPTITTPDTGGKTRNRKLTDQFGNPLWDDGTPFTDTREEKPVDPKEDISTPTPTPTPTPTVFNNNDTARDQGFADETYTEDQQFNDWAYSQGWKQEVVRGEKVWRKQTRVRGAFSRPGGNSAGQERVETSWMNTNQLKSLWDKSRGIVPAVVKPPVTKWNWGDNTGMNPFVYGQTKQKTMTAAQGLANGTGDDVANLQVLKDLYSFNSTYWQQRGWKTFDDFLESLLTAHYTPPPQDPNTVLNDNQVGV